MKRIYILLLSCFFICNIQGIYSQSMYDTYRMQAPQVTCPAPTSQMLRKYLDYPVSYATGTIDITIPLYELKCSGLNIPIHLKYHSSGIKASDYMGIVGYGWTLFPGFKISRTIMGKPDERYPVKEIPDIGNIVSEEERVRKLIDLAVPASKGDINTTSDGQYDIFSVHLPDMNASFILEYANGQYTPRLLPDSPLEISFYINPAILSKKHSFEIKDDKGNHYYFGGGDEFVETVDETGGSPIVGWMLEKIIQANGEEINFHYKETLEHQEITPYYCTITDNAMSISGFSVIQTELIAKFKAMTGNAGVTVDYRTDTRSARIQKVPTSITSKNNKIAFNYSRVKPVGQSNEYLSSIYVTSGSALVKKVTLSNNGNFLDNVNIDGEGVYKFGYNTESILGTDWWGFSNGSNPTYNIPKITIPTKSYLNSFGAAQIIGDTSKESNAIRMTARSLTKVVYPTGGHMQIYYEPHKFDVGGVDKIGAGLRIKSLGISILYRIKQLRKAMNMKKLTIQGADIRQTMILYGKLH